MLQLAGDTFRTLVVIALIPGIAAVAVIIVGVRDVPRRAVRVVRLAGQDHGHRVRLDVGPAARVDGAQRPAGG